MEWLIVTIAALVVLFPVAFIWFINIGGIYAAIKKAKAGQTASEKSRGFTYNREAEGIANAK